MKVSLNWIQEYIDDTLPPVNEVVEALTMHSFEIEGVEDSGDDKILDVKVLPNRSHDCLSHYGIASEICSVLNLKRKDLLSQVTLSKTDKLSVSISTKNSSRAMKVLVTGVRIGESPEWLKQKLNLLGSRSINSVVDMTNYLTFAFGQPIHAFDAGKVSQNRKGQYVFNIRDAIKGEKITLLDGKEYTLDETMMVIADDTKALDVAGVMGGKETGVGVETTDIVLSFSGFNPVSVRKTAKSLGIRTDASQRFENEISASLVERVLPYALKLVVELTGGTVAGGVDVYKNPEKLQTVSVPLKKITSMLNLTITGEEAVELLARQNIMATVDGDKIVVTAPLHRLDIKIPEDVVEEIGRLYGYKNIEPAPLTLEAKVVVNEEVYITDSIRKFLTQNGFNEIYTYAFTSGGDIEIENPLAGDKKFLRNNLSSGMEESLEKNFKYLDLLGIEEVKLFEIGKVFTKKGEELHISLGVKYPKNYNRAKPSSGRMTEKVNVDEEIARTITLIEEHLNVSIGDVSILSGVVEFDLARIKKELDPTEKYPEDLWNMENKEVQYKTISAYPFAVRDVAVFVPNEIEVSKVEELIKQHLNTNVVRFAMFDKFTKEEKTSYAFRLVFQSNEKTLTEEEINSVMNPIYETLKAHEGFEIR